MSSVLALSRTPKGKQLNNDNNIISSSLLFKYQHLWHLGFCSRYRKLSWGTRIIFILKYFLSLMLLMSPPPSSRLWKVQAVTDSRPAVTCQITEDVRVPGIVFASLNCCSGLTYASFPQREDWISSSSGKVALNTTNCGYCPSIFVFKTKIWNSSADMCKYPFVQVFQTQFLKNFQPLQHCNQ